jgi:hypothetical protein
LGQEPISSSTWGYNKEIPCLSWNPKVYYCVKITTNHNSKNLTKCNIGKCEVKKGPNKISWLLPLFMNYQ